MAQKINSRNIVLIISILCYQGFTLVAPPPFNNSDDYDCYDSVQNYGFPSRFKGEGNQHKLLSILKMRKEIIKMRNECSTLDNTAKSKQERILDTLETALESETGFVSNETNTFGQAQNAFILAMSNNNPNIHTFSGALVHSLIKPLAKTVNTVGEQFWNNVFARTEKLLSPILIGLGFKPAVREQDIDSIKNIAENIKQRLLYLSKQSDASFGSGKALNLRLAKQDQYAFEGESSTTPNNTDSTTNESQPLDISVAIDQLAKEMFLDLINMGFIEINICLSKCKIANKKDAVSERLEIMYKRFTELHKIFTNITNIQELLKEGAFHKIQASCDLIMMLCQDLKQILLDKPQPRRSQPSYDYLGKRMDDNF